MRLVYTAPAIADLDEIHAYLAERDPHAAERVIDRILQLGDVLARFPLIAPPGPLPGTHQIIVPNIPYRIVYEIEGAELRVLRVVHARRLWPPAEDS